MACPRQFESLGSLPTLPCRPPSPLAIPCTCRLAEYKTVVVSNPAEAADRRRKEVGLRRWNRAALPMPHPARCMRRLPPVQGPPSTHSHLVNQLEMLQTVAISVQHKESILRTKRLKRDASLGSLGGLPLSRELSKASLGALRRAFTAGGPTAS